jgi:endonuclease YncB( thermonuclease family)
MTYYALKGTFTTELTSPDGDTIRFRPDAPANLGALLGAQRLGELPQPGPQPGASATGYTIPVRLEAIDAPELHYAGAKQRRAATARTRLLHRLGLRDWSITGDTITGKKGVAARGWVIADQIDINRRVIGLVYRDGDLPLARDAEHKLDRATLLRSANADMLASGAAYHLAYSTLDRAVREPLQALAVEARKHRRGVWSHDSTRAFALRGLGSICERGSLVFPKLLRRCVTFCQEQSRRFVAADFVRWLRATPGADDLVELGGRRVRLSALLTGGREWVRCCVDPMGIVFVPKG